MKLGKIEPSDLCMALEERVRVKRGFLGLGDQLKYKTDGVHTTLQEKVHNQF